MIVRTPPMGWNTWNTFGPNINEALIMESADAMVSTGLKDAGYEYIVIDDCWSLKQRDENGRLVADPEKFPHGIKYVADYIHSLGLKFGMYSCAGPLTCAGYPGSLGRELEDAQFFAENEVDFLKYDFCYHPDYTQAFVLYNRMKMALAATGRDILYSICNWGTENVHNWAKAVGGNMYRSTYDISDKFADIQDIFTKEKNNFNLSGPSCYNDMDMLVCGMFGKGNVAQGGCNQREYETHFALWCMLGAPLMIGCDIRNMTPETKALLTNKELIAINQDPEVRPPHVTCSDNERYPILFKHLANGEYAVSITNFESEVTDWIKFILPEIGLDVADGYGLKMYDVITGEDLGIFEDLYRVTVYSHQTRVMRGKLVKVK